MSVKLRIATEQDTQKILNIYSFYIKATAVTFEYEVPTLGEFKKRVDKVQKQFPWLVCEVDHEIAGYAYASLHKERAAYQWNIESSIYLSWEHQGEGIGTKLYKALLEVLTCQGYYNAYACITLPNKQSITMHKNLGFHEIGVFQSTGNKFNKWYDVIWLGKQLSKYEDVLTQPISIRDLDASIVEKVILKYETI